MLRKLPVVVAVVLAVVVVAVLVAGVGLVVGSSGDGSGVLGPGGVEISASSAGPSSDAAGSSSAAPTNAAAPLAGKVVVLDAGHQLGNHNFPSEVARLVDAGGFEKPCNTTGTASNAGYPEATFTWNVTLAVRRILERAGARVLLTRHRNSESAWGPCVDVRGRAGNPGQPGPTADVKLSIHADGALSGGAHGFHVIAPESVPGRTARIAGPSLTLARWVRDTMVAAGFAPSTYRGERGIDVRGDLGTLNLAQQPAAMIECGNMRDPADAAMLTSRRGQLRIARTLARALERYLAR